MLLLSVVTVPEVSVAVTRSYNKIFPFRFKHQYYQPAYLRIMVSIATDQWPVVYSKTLSSDKIYVIFKVNKQNIKQKHYRDIILTKKETVEDVDQIIFLLYPLQLVMEGLYGNDKAVDSTAPRRVSSLDYHAK